MRAFGCVRVSRLLLPKVALSTVFGVTVATLSLTHGQTNCTADLPVPLTTSNLIFEYAEFHNSSAGR